jgi:hypothetical protein
MKITIGDNSYFIVHNGDWSGEAEIVQIDPKSHDVILRHKLPGELLIAIGKKVALEKIRSDIISFVEEYE